MLCWLKTLERNVHHAEFSCTRKYCERNVRYCAVELLCCVNCDWQESISICHRPDWGPHTFFFGRLLKLVGVDDKVWEVCFDELAFLVKMQDQLEALKYTRIVDWFK